MKRPSLLVAVVVVLLALAGCGGDGKAPLTLEQRLPQQDEVPSYLIAPSEIMEWNDAAAFATAIADGLVQATVEDATDVLTEAGFVSAVGRSFGGGEAVELFAVVIQFASEDGAETVSEWRAGDIRMPCIAKCFVDITEFTVDGIPNADPGIRRTVTQDALDAAGETGPPFDSYEVGFTDGRFAYNVRSFGEPGSVSAAETVDVLKRLYERVNGAPIPSA